MYKIRGYIDSILARKGERYWIDFYRKGARLDRFTPGSYLPFEKLGRFKIVIRRIYVDYERMAFFSTRNLHKKADIATARRDVLLAQLQISRPISLRVYRRTAKSLQEFLIRLQLCVRLLNFLPTAVALAVLGV